VDRFAQSHVCSGRNPIRIGSNTADLRNDLPAWCAIWAELRDELLPQFIRENPGRRPAAWWRFDAPHNVDLTEDETEVEVLHAAGLLSDPEVESITAKARELLAYNRGRDPDDEASGFIPDHHGYAAFASDHGLLTDEEADDEADDGDDEAFDADDD
jgi:hypothetical protein